MKALSSLARKATGLPISFSGLPMRPSGMIFSRTALSVGSASEAGDWTIGITILTRIFCFAHSIAAGPADRLDRRLHPGIDAVMGRPHHRAAAEIDDAAAATLLHVRIGQPHEG